MYMPLPANAGLPKVLGPSIFLHVLSPLYYIEKNHIQTNFSMT